MNRLRTAYAVFCVTLFLILPLFFYTHAVASTSVTVMKSSGPTSAYVGNACGLDNYSVVDNVYVTSSDGSYIISNGCYITRRFGGVAEFGWRRNTNVSIISADCYKVTLGTIVLNYEPFAYCDIALAYDSLGQYAIIGDTKIYCDEFTVSSNCYTTVSLIPIAYEMLTTHGKPIEAERFFAVLLSNDDAVRIDNGMIYVSKIGISDVRLLTADGLIVKVQINNSAYIYSNIESDTLTLKARLEYDSYEILRADSCISVDLAGNIVFACNGVYTIDYIKDEYHTVVTYTVTISDVDNDRDDIKPDAGGDNNGNNSGNNSDDESTDENDKPDISAGDNDSNNNSADIENSGNNNEINDDEHFSNTDTKYDFNITRQPDNAKIAMISAFTLISAIGVIVLLVFLKRTKTKR